MNFLNLFVKIEYLKDETLLHVAFFGPWEYLSTHPMYCSSEGFDHLEILSQDNNEDDYSLLLLFDFSVHHFEFLVESRDIHLGLIEEIYYSQRICFGFGYDYQKDLVSAAYLRLTGSD